MRRIIIVLVTLTVTLFILFTGCSKKEELNSEGKTTSIDNTVAGETALSYLSEKYGEEFTIVSENQMHDSILGGNRWYRATVVKKSDEDNDNARTYEVHVTFDDGSYTVAGDTVIFTYIQRLVKNYLEPIISNYILDFPYEIIIIKGNESRYGYSSNFRIPTNDEDIYEIQQSGKIGITFWVMIPLSADNEEILNICKSIKSDLNNSKFEWCAYIKIIDDESFEKIKESNDPYVQVVQNDDYTQYELYSIT